MTELWVFTGEKGRENHLVPCYSPEIPIHNERHEKKIVANNHTKSFPAYLYTAASLAEQTPEMQSQASLPVCSARRVLT